MCFKCLLSACFVCTYKRGLTSMCGGVCVAVCVSCGGVCVFHVVVCVFRVVVWWLGVEGQVKRSCWPAAQYDRQ